jgi:hypothetical protein
MCVLHVGVMQYQIARNERSIRKAIMFLPRFDLNFPDTDKNRLAIDQQSSYVGDVEFLL